MAAAGLTGGLTQICMTITKGKTAELAAQYGLDAELVKQLLQDAGLTIVPDFAGNEDRPGATIPTDRLRECDLAGELQPDGQVWVAKSRVGHKNRFVSQDMWYQLAEVVAQSGGSTYLHEP